MKLNSKGIKILKVLHLLFAMAWIVGILGMWVLSLLSPRSGDELFMLQTGILWIDHTLTIPGAICTIITAIIYGGCTNWGFFKYRWITVKWVVSIGVILVGTFWFHPSSLYALEIIEQDRMAALVNMDVISAMSQTRYSSLIQATILIVLVVISVFKPWKNTIKKEKGDRNSIRLSN